MCRSGVLACQCAEEMHCVAFTICDACYNLHRVPTTAMDRMARLHEQRDKDRLASPPAPAPAVIPIASKTGVAIAPKMLRKK